MHTAAFSCTNTAENTERRRLKTLFINTSRGNKVYISSRHTKWPIVDAISKISVRPAPWCQNKLECTPKLVYRRCKNSTLEIKKLTLVLFAKDAFKCVLWGSVYTPRKRYKSKFSSRAVSIFLGCKLCTHSGTWSDLLGVFKSVQQVINDEKLCPTVI
jgi:hypothetical protein